MSNEIDPARRAAYQRLLCYAFADIATRSRHAEPNLACIGAISEWLHTLAAHSAHDFARFHEKWFWLGHQTLCRRYPGRNLEGYRLYFELRRAEFTAR